MVDFASGESPEYKPDRGSYKFSLSSRFGIDLQSTVCNRLDLNKYNLPKPIKYNTLTYKVPQLTYQFAKSDFIRDFVVEAPLAVISTGLALYSFSFFSFDGAASIKNLSSGAATILFSAIAYGFVSDLYLVSRQFAKRISILRSQLTHQRPGPQK